MSDQRRNACVMYKKCSLSYFMCVSVEPLLIRLNDVYFEKYKRNSQHSLISGYHCSSSCYFCSPFCTHMQLSITEDTSSSTELVCPITEWMFGMKWRKGSADFCWKYLCQTWVEQLDTHRWIHRKVWTVLCACNNKGKAMYVRTRKCHIGAIINSLQQQALSCGHHVCVGCAPILLSIYKLKHKNNIKVSCSNPKTIPNSQTYTQQQQQLQQQES